MCLSTEQGDDPEYGSQNGRKIDQEHNEILDLYFGVQFEKRILNGSAEQLFIGKSMFGFRCHNSTSLYNALEEFGNRSERQRREEAECANQQDNEDQQEHKHGVGCGKGAGCGCDSLLSRQAAGNGQCSDDRKEPYKQHNQAKGYVEKYSVGVKAGECGAIVSAC